jgi:hypothetical protein
MDVLTELWKMLDPYTERILRKCSVTVSYLFLYGEGSQLGMSYTQKPS